MIARSVLLTCHVSIMLLNTLYALCWLLIKVDYYHSKFRYYVAITLRKILKIALCVNNVVQSILNSSPE